MHSAVVGHGGAVPPGLAAGPGRTAAVRVPEASPAARVVLFTRCVHLFTRRRHQDRDKPDRKCRRRVKSRDHGRPAGPRQAGPARRRHGIGMLFAIVPLALAGQLPSARAQSGGKPGRSGDKPGTRAQSPESATGPLHHLNCPCTLTRE
jgi:hypothetical protein